MAGLQECPRTMLPCYATELQSFKAFGAIRSRQNVLITELDDFMTFLKARSALEESYGKGLQRLGHSALQGVPSSLYDAMEAMRADVSNKAVQHLELSELITKELYVPLGDLRRRLVQKKQAIHSMAAKLQKDVLKAEGDFRRAQRAFEKSFADCRAELVAMKLTHREVEDLDRRVRGARAPRRAARTTAARS